MVIYIDDVLISGLDESSHLSTLEEILRHMEQAGLRLRLNVSSWQRQLSFLGTKLMPTDFTHCQVKVRAVKQAPTPRNITELKAYLGLLTFYTPFLGN